MNARPARGNTVAPSMASLSADGRARLLDITRVRLFYSASVTPFAGMAFIIWFYLLGQDISWLLVELAAYLLGVWLLFVLRRRYLADRASLDSEKVLEKWLPVVKRIAVLHGFGLALVVFLTAGKVTFEFAAVLHITFAGTIAANATHQTPVWGVFLRFFLCCWVPVVLMMPWTVPEHWHFVLPMAVLFGIAMCRHGVTSHRFFVQQIKLEEDSAALAKRFRDAKEQAEQALQDKNRFLTTASHDLRQPVHAMGFLIQAIAHRNRDETLREPIRDLQQSVRSVDLMFNSLLDLSKMETGAVTAQRTPVLLDAIVEDVATTFREEANSRGLDLRIRIARREAVVLGDASLIRRCLINLTHNALRYTPQGGVLLSVRHRQGSWLLEVWDTGIGVALEEQKNIYTQFYRNAYSWGIDSAGHGLGLAMVARSAKIMGAGYGLNSVEGRGSRFWLSLPEMKQMKTGHMVSGNAMRSSLTRLVPLTGSCLVIDDDPLVTKAWQSLMEAWGVEVRCAASGAEAFELLRGGFQPQAILCDQRLRSGESGFEVFQALLEACPESGGAMVSGEFHSPVLEQAERDGYLVLRKPLQPPQLHAVLSQWLEPAEAATESDRSGSAG